jgi:hypothetical protein
MKIISKILICLTAILSLGIVAQPALAASTSEQIGDQTVALVNAVDRFVDNFEVAETDAQATAATLALQSTMSLVRTNFEAAAESADNNDLKKYATEFATLAERFSVAAGQMNQAFIDADDTAYDVAVAAYNATLEDYNNKISSYNKLIADNPLASGDSTYILWFAVLALSVVCLVVAVVIFAAGRNQFGTIPGSEDGKKKPVSLKMIRRNILIGAAIFLVGAAIPAVQYYIAVHNVQYGERFDYYIFWYPLAIGVIMFVFNLFKYFITYAKLKKAGELKYTDDDVSVASSK